jgi:hypothetical protein
VAAIYLYILPGAETTGTNTNLIFLKILLGFIAALSITVAIYFYHQRKKEKMSA